MKSDKELSQKMSAMFEDFEADPQTESWESIQKAIAKPSVKRFPLGVFYVCLLMLIAAIGVWLFYPSSLHSSAKKENPKKDIAEPLGRTDFSPSKKDGLKSALPNDGLKPIRPKENTQIPTITTKNTLFSSPSLPSTNPRIHRSVKDSSMNSLQTQTDINSIQNGEKPIGQSDSSAINRIALTAIPLIQANINYSLSSLTTQVSLPLLNKKHKKGYFTAAISACAAYQLMQVQAGNNHSVGDVSLLSTFDKQRLGISAAVGYHLRIAPKQGLGFAISGFSLPRIVSYQLQNNHIFTVTNQANGKYFIQKKADAYTQKERLIFLGAEMTYDYTFTLKEKPIIAFVGAGISRELSLSTNDYWLNTGIALPITKHLQFLPSYKYQLNTAVDKHKLMQTRLYTLGVGLRYAW